MSERILITSALPYANGSIHFGHIAGAYLPADCYARYQRLKGYEVLYLCGSDEYGIAVALSAELAKRSPKEQVDYFHELNQKLFKQFGISFDHYSRTTWPGHIPVVQEFFTDLYKNGYIEEKTEEHLYSEKENKFLADRYVVGTCPRCGFEAARGDECQKCSASYEAIDLKNPTSKLTGSKLIRKPSKHWYMRFDKFKSELTSWLDQKQEWKANVLSFAMNYIKELKPRGVTRDSNWGVPIPLPDTEGKVLYVWFDAPIGYISAAKEWAERIHEKDKWKEYWLDPRTKVVNFIGKDNIPFHTVFFPAMIMGQNTPYNLVTDVPANEFLLLEGRQFSKSDGWYIDLEDFFSKYTTDQIRYYLAANAPETADSEFTWKEFQQRSNTELLAKFGNFAHRTLTFIQNNCEGRIPPLHTLTDVDEEFLNEISLAINEIENAYERYSLKKASQILMELSQKANAYFDKKRPWALVKEGDKKAMQTTLHICLLAIKSLALISSPIIPFSAQRLWEMLGFSSLLEKQHWGEVRTRKLSVAQSLPLPQILFVRVEDDQIEAEIKKLRPLEKKPVDFSSYSPLKETITIQDFEKMDLRVGKILDAQKVPKSSKLLKLSVDLGFEIRQIVSGIAKDYSPEELIGKKAIILANLKSAKLMDIESQGMLLAAVDEKAEVPFVIDQKPGSRVC